MDDTEFDRRLLVSVAAKVLTYPSSTWKQEYTALADAIDDEMNVELGRKVIHAINPLYQLPIQMIREHYVQTFDLKEKTGLYLTAHELGDSRKRGMEIVKLQNLIQQEGYLFRADELSDYIPMLYEFLTLIWETEHAPELKWRLSVATQRIRKHLDEDNMYRPLISLLMAYAFVQPTDDEMEQWEKNREKPDLDPMPYPLMYK